MSTTNVNIEPICEVVYELFLSSTEKSSKSLQEAGASSPANLVDALFSIARSIDRLASVVTKALEGEE